MHRSSSTVESTAVADEGGESSCLDVEVIAVCEEAACHALERRLEEELRTAKSAQIGCVEMLLPAELLSRIAKETLQMAENEPCGLRGCTLYINIESEQDCRQVGIVHCDPGTVSTFELYLTLKQDLSSWHSLVPQFLRTLTGGTTIMISQSFTLHKKKLYRSNLQ